MNIAIFTNNYFPNPYGVTGSIESFRKQFEKRGHRVFIFAPNWPDYIDKNHNVYRYPAVDITFKFRFPLAIPYSRKMDKIIEKLDLDIIHSQHPNLLGTAARKWARKKNIPLIFTWHTLYDKYAHFASIIPKEFAANWIINRAVKYANSADQVIVPTPSVRNIIEDWGVTNNRIIDIPTGIEEEVYQNPEGLPVRNKYNIKDSDVLLLLVSRLTEEKNIKFLFRSVMQVLKSNATVKFLIAGEGYLVPQLKKLTKANNISDKVIFAGLVDKKDLKNYYAAGDIFVYASKSETQGMIISEAMYSGLPIVAIKATGVQDLVSNGENGILVPENSEDFASAVSRLVKDVDLRNKYSAESKKIAQEKYTSTVCAEKMINIYEKAIKRKIS